jgi:hypothetical protein
MFGVKTGRISKWAHIQHLDIGILDASRKFYVLLTVHLGSVLVNNQLDAQFFCKYTRIASRKFGKQSSAPVGFRSWQLILILCASW